MPFKNLIEKNPKTSQATYWQHTNYHLFPGGKKKLTFIVGALEKLAQKSPLKILDIGCGNGSITFPIGSLGYDILGIDFSAESIQLAQSKNTFPNVRFQQHDLAASPLPERFNCVICSEVLEHLHNPGLLLRAIARVMEPSGCLIITVPNGYGLREVLGRVEKRLRQIPGVNRLVDGMRALFGMRTEKEKHAMHTSNPDQGHVQKFTPASLRRLLQSHHFDVAQWVNSFWFLSLFGKARTGEGWIASLDSRLAEILPPHFASGWYLLCRRSK